jgi:hypothetical protein
LRVENGSSWGSRIRATVVAKAEAGEVERVSPDER